MQQTMRQNVIENAALVALVMLVLAAIVAVRPVPKVQLHCHDGSCHAHGVK